MSAYAISPGIPRAFRTYDRGSNQDYNCCIWEAGCATMASLFHFKPIRIGSPGMKEPFISGSLGCNNPLNTLLEDAYRMFPARHIACILSLGAGELSPASVLPRLDLTDILIEIAKDCEGTANEAELRFAQVPGVYFRFNVTQGLQPFGDEDWDRANAVRAHTSTYLSKEDVTAKMEKAVGAASARRPGKVSTRQLRT